MSMDSILFNGISILGSLVGSLGLQVSGVQGGEPTKHAGLRHCFLYLLLNLRRYVSLQLRHLVERRSFRLLLEEFVNSRDLNQGQAVCPGFDRWLTGKSLSLAPGPMPLILLDFLLGAISLPALTVPLAQPQAPLALYPGDPRLLGGKILSSLPHIIISFLNRPEDRMRGCLADLQTFMADFTVVFLL